MVSGADNRVRRQGVPWRVVGWGALGLLLLFPYMAGAPWTASDYVFAAVLFGALGGGVELILRLSSSLAYRAGGALAVFAAFATIWVNAAVGMIGSEDNPYNLIFIGLLFVALIGAVVGRFRAAGMMWAMAATGAGQIAAAAVGAAVDPHGGVFSMGFAGMWLLAAALFWVAARESRAVRS